MKPLTYENLIENVEYEPNSGCWLWSGLLDRQGYGRVWEVVAGVTRATTAHKALYLSVVGPVPTGLELDHRCRTRCCVNPAHLEPVTHQENCRRGARGVLRPLVTHCINGHEYDEANTRTYFRRDGRKRRACRACDRAATARCIERRKSRQA